MTENNAPLLLLIEDDEKVQQFNKPLLERRGFTVYTAVTLAQAWEAIKRRQPDAIVLDIGMPDGSGLDFLRELRRESQVPVLLLTGYNKDMDIVEGFNCGCNDYLAKPYTFEVLLARLGCMLRDAERVPKRISKGALTLNLARLEAYTGEENLLLTPKDFALLQFFMQNEERVMTMEEIYETVWGKSSHGDSRAAYAAVMRIRKKLHGSGYTITSVYGEGYRFERGE